MEYEKKPQKPVQLEPEFWHKLKKLSFYTGLSMKNIIQQSLAEKYPIFRNGENKK